MLPEFFRQAQAVSSSNPRRTEKNTQKPSSPDQPPPPITVHQSTTTRQGRQAASIRTYRATKWPVHREKAGLAKPGEDGVCETLQVGRANPQGLHQQGCICRPRFLAYHRTMKVPGSHVSLPPTVIFDAGGRQCFNGSAGGRFVVSNSTSNRRLRHAPCPEVGVLLWGSRAPPGLPKFPTRHNPHGHGSAAGGHDLKGQVRHVYVLSRLLSTRSHFAGFSLRQPCTECVRVRVGRTPHHQQLILSQCDRRPNPKGLSLRESTTPIA